MDWYRAYVGTCADEKIGEAALISGEPKILVISVWHLLLESACHDEADGAYSTTPRRMAATLGEPVVRIETAIGALTEVGMIRGGEIVAWAKRQPRSMTPTAEAERQRRSRSARRAPAEPADPAPVTACHDVSRPVTPCHALEGEEEEETETDSLPRQARGREREEPGGPNVVGFDRLTRLGEDALEAEVRTLLGALPVVVDPDFSPIRRLLDEGLTRADVLAGASAILARGYRPRDWGGLEKSIRYAAKDRLAAGLPGIRDGPRGGARSQKSSNLAFFNRIAYGPGPNDAPARLAGAAGAGPVIEGRAGSM